MKLSSFIEFCTKNPHWALNRAPCDVGSSAECRGAVLGKSSQIVVDTAAVIDNSYMNGEYTASTLLSVELNIFTVG